MLHPETCLNLTFLKLLYLSISNWKITSKLFVLLLFIYTKLISFLYLQIKFQKGTCQKNVFDLLSTLTQYFVGIRILSFLNTKKYISWKEKDRFRRKISDGDFKNKQIELAWNRILLSSFVTKKISAILISSFFFKSITILDIQRFHLKLVKSY